MPWIAQKKRAFKRERKMPRDHDQLCSHRLLQRTYASRLYDGCVLDDYKAWA